HWGIVLLLPIINQRCQKLWLSIRRVTVPIVVVLVLTVTGMGFYNLRVTGNPLRLPYQIHEEIYVMAPPFLWQRLPAEPEYRHKIIRDFHATHALSFYTSQRSLPGFPKENIYPLLSLGFWSVNVFLIPIIVVF